MANEGKKGLKNHCKAKIVKINAKIRSASWVCGY